MDLTKTVRRITVPFTKQMDAATPTGEIKGYASVFGNKDFGGDIVHPGAFNKSMEKYKAAGNMPNLFYMHDRTNPVGDWLKMHEDGTGLVKSGVLWINKGIPSAEQAYCMVKGTGVVGLSIGYIPVKYDIDSKNKTVNLTEVNLLESSVVSWPMNEKAIVTSVKSLLLKTEDGAFRSVREMEQILRDAGLSHVEAKAFLSKGYRGLGLRDAELEKEEKDAVETRILASLKTLLPK